MLQTRLAAFMERHIHAWFIGCIELHIRCALFSLYNICEVRHGDKSPHDLDLGSWPFVRRVKISRCRYWNGEKKYYRMLHETWCYICATMLYMWHDVSCDMMLHVTWCYMWHDALCDVTWCYMMMLYMWHDASCYMWHDAICEMMLYVKWVLHVTRCYMWHDVLCDIISHVT